MLGQQFKYSIYTLTHWPWGICVISKLIFVIGGWDISSEVAL